MEVVGENADGDRLKAALGLNGLVDGAQAIDVTDEKIAGAVGESHGEEESAAFDFDASVVRHRNIFTCNEDVGTALRAFAHPTKPTQKAKDRRKAGPL